MWFTRLVAMLVAAAAVWGSAHVNAEDIALSMVHPKGRIDVPASAITEVEARAITAFRIKETGKVNEFSNPHVDVCFTKDIGERLCALTQQIVGEPLAIVICCETVEKPIVREPLCHSCLAIGYVDLAEANAMAQRIRRGTSRACAASSHDMRQCQNLGG